jgi:heme exporter protein A
MTTLLRFGGVALRRGGRLLFDDLDLELGPGEALQVTGPNGSGKSSLLRLAAGLLRADRGTVERGSLALADDQIARERQFARAPALGLWSRDVDPALRALGIDHLAEVPVRWLSSGQRKRATLARVASSGAPLWLLDEPLNALDNIGATLVTRLIDAHRATGGAVLAVSHQPLGGHWNHIELGG